MNLQQDSNKQLIQQRINLLYIPIILIFLVLAGRLWQLQIIQGSEYAEKAERNRIRTIQVVAPRGTISDRNSVPLVENRPSFNIQLYRESIKNLEDTSRFITEKLGMPPEDLAERLRRSKSSGTYQPIVIKGDAGIGDISVVEAHRKDHPELQLGPEPRRLYRLGKVAAHVLGYVGEVSEDELSRGLFQGIRVGSLVGKTGVERVYNQCLIGKDGVRQVLVDSVGREVDTLDEIPSVIGGELTLTLDLDLQTTAESLLQDKVGAIIAMDPRNGEILAMASAPSFDPNAFSTRILKRDWDQLVNDPDHPLQNRAIQNAYSPGSIFKLVMADAGLEEGMVTEGTHVNCNGAASFYNRVFHCWQKKGHGTVNLQTAITQSCNIFFYDLGQRLGISKIAEHGRALGLGERTGIDLPGERSGVMPSAEWKEQTRGVKWFAGETISVSIGQGYVTATPLQLLRTVSAIATGGTLATPHVLLRAEGLPNDPSRWPARQIPIGEENTRRIRAGMWGSVNNGGTGHNAAIPGFDICGKTGTVQVLSKETRISLQGDTSAFEDHSWFAGFANRDNPEVSVVVFVEHGGKGGVAAAPLAHEVFKAYFAKRRHPELLTQLKDPAVGVSR
ncbi:MAG TPA: penicillin-binding protein 2 [Acidobacteriota bacterium]|nr:penicillin-binding protein 2 [Acidobacteriota bacterium]